MNGYGMFESTAVIYQNTPVIQTWWKNNICLLRVLFLYCLLMCVVTVHLPYFSLFGVCIHVILLFSSHHSCFSQPWFLFPPCYRIPYSSVSTALLTSSFFFSIPLHKQIPYPSSSFASLTSFLLSLFLPCIFFIFSFKSCTCLLFFNIFLCCPPARLPPVRVEESSFSQDLQWLLERGVQFADVAFYGGDCGKELGWAHASVLCAISPYFRQLLVGRQKRERPVSRCTCREREGPHSLMSTWDVGVDDLPRADGHPSGHISRLVVKDPLLCLCLWETLMFLYRGETVSSIKADVVRGKVCLGNQAIYKKEQL